MCSLRQVFDQEKKKWDSDVQPISDLTEVNNKNLIYFKGCKVGQSLSISETETFCVQPKPLV